jgi:hypothetical protein
MRFGRTNAVKVAILAAVWSLRDCSALSSLRQPKGSAATPLQKKKIAVLGGGGYSGGVVFGFLQRACSLYGTGFGAVRTIGATANTAVRLNRLLSKNFCLAVADESLIKLTDLQSVQALEQRLEGWDAVIFGTDLALQKRSVTANTYEKSPNDKTVEAYWGALGGVADGDEIVSTMKTDILENLLQASKQAGVKHMVVVQDVNSQDWLPQLERAGLAYTYIRPTGALVTTKDYTYRKGLQGSLSVSTMAGDDVASFGAETSSNPISTEDLAALCVQCLQSLDWERSRCLSVSCNGALDVESLGPATKRPDQEWCVNSSVLQAALAGIA